jgi:tetrapyrrole methylase family protein/MazG family protein
MEKKYTFLDLVDIMEKLRSENGCPWDKEQTHESLTKNLIEEAYEACDAIEENSKEKTVEELGDVLLQVVFHAQIGKEDGEYTMDDITTAICQKLIYRHPHIFQDTKLKTADEVLTNWEKLKNSEKGYVSETDSMKKIPRNFPALMRAFKVQEKAHRVGFDWPDVEGAFQKVTEETGELFEAMEKEDDAGKKEEIGDLLFAVVNVCRFLDIDPEQYLNKATDKFIRRFEYVEGSCVKNGLNMKNMTIDELDLLWDEAKV